MGRAIHGTGPRSGEPFLLVDCAALSEDLLEAEIFGHEPGALPEARTLKRGLLELAGDGVLLLKNVDRVPVSLQPKLQRALEDGHARRVGSREEVEIRCTIMATSPKTLRDAVERGRFRRELFDRLNGASLQIPPLRDRREDIAMLAEHFVQQLAADEGLLPKPLADEALAVLEKYDWPGNVRELRQVVQRAVAAAKGPTIDAGAINLNPPCTEKPGPHPSGSAHWVAIPQAGRSMREIEAEAIRITLGLVAGNRSAASRVLGISRPTLIRKIRAYDLDRS